jgi:hypothetical protein
MQTLIRETAKSIAFGPAREPRDTTPPDPANAGDLKQARRRGSNKLSDDGKERASDQEKIAAIQKYHRRVRRASAGSTIRGTQTPRDRVGRSRTTPPLAPTRSRPSSGESRRSAQPATTEEPPTSPSRTRLLLDASPG